MGHTNLPLISGITDELAERGKQEWLIVRDNGVNL